jgi:hypothetical protein
MDAGWGCQFTMLCEGAGTKASSSHAHSGAEADASRIAKRNYQAPEKGGFLGLILRQAQDEAERFQWLGPHGELVEPWATPSFSILLK